MPEKSEKNKQPNNSLNPDYKIKKGGIKSPEVFAEGIFSGDRALLSRAITLIESNRPEYQAHGREILDLCLEKTGNSVRIGITGVPGVGKSTFIDSLGQKLIKEEKRKVAVLAVDPSSSRSKGSILGDKTRMESLSASDHAYIRPTPASGSLGGVAYKTREAILLCEAAGFDTILIETVGVGQSETAVKQMVDFFLLLMLPGAGDELQGVKRGIMEMADLIAINKADGGQMKNAEQAKTEYKNALSLFPPQESGWKVPVLTCSALEGTGLDAVWESVAAYFDETMESGFFDENRKNQSVLWMHELIGQQLKKNFYTNRNVGGRIEQIEKMVVEGKISSNKAAEELLNLYRA